MQPETAILIQFYQALFKHMDSKKTNSGKNSEVLSKTSEEKQQNQPSKHARKLRQSEALRQNLRRRKEASGKNE